MNAHSEIKELIVHLRTTLNVHRDLGLDPPCISDHDLMIQRNPEFGAAGVSNASNHTTGLKTLMAEVAECRRCKLHRTRTHMVFGEGAARARLVFVGEGPGRDEDMEGRPFVGEAGKLLTRIIEDGMGLDRKEVYIANVVKCRPPKNRDPEEDEIQNCIPILNRQLEIIRPEVICALGRVAGQAMLGKDFSISRKRGQWVSYMGIPLMPTYHPAYLLRNPDAKRHVWNDVQKIMKRLGIEVKKL